MTQLAPMQIAVDYAKPEEFAAKLRVTAACYPVAFAIPSRFALMVAQRLDAADRETAALHASTVEMDDLLVIVSGRIMDLQANHDRWVARYSHIGGVVLAFALAAAVVDFAKAVLL